MWVWVDKGRLRLGEQGADQGPPQPELTGTSFVSLPRFPSEHFGKLFGLLMALSAVVSLLQFPIFTLIKGPLQSDPFYVSTVAGWGTLALDQQGCPDWDNCVGPQQGAPPPGWGGLGVVPAGAFLHMGTSLVLLLKLGSVGVPCLVLGVGVGVPEARGLT